MKNCSRSSVRSVLRWGLAVFATVLAVASWPSPASAADNSLVAATPAPNGTLEQSPVTITLLFAQPVGPSPRVVMTCGDPAVTQSLANPVLIADQVTVQVDVLAPAPKGTCQIAWQVTDTTLQPAGSGSFTFTIANDPVVTTAPPTTVPSVSTIPNDTTPGTTVAPAPTPSDGGAGTDGEGGSDAWVGVFRLGSIIGVSLLFGGLVIIAMAWPEGVEYILTVRYLRYAWAAAVASTFLYIGALTAQQTGQGLGSTLSPTAWPDVLDSTPGKAAVLRFVLLLVAFYVAARPERAIDTTTQVVALGPPTVAVLTLAFSRDEFGPIEWLAGGVHALAMAVWLGGLWLLARVVLAGPGDEDLVHAVRGYSRLSAPAIWITVASGAVLLFRLDRGHLGSDHGLVLVVKTLFVAIMVFVAYSAKDFIAKRVARTDVMTAQLAVRLRRALGIEAAVGIVVLVLTSWLLSLSPPGLQAGSGPALDLQPSHQFVDAAQTTQILVSFTERVGANDVRIQVITPTAGISDLAVDFLPPAGTAGQGMTIDPVGLTGTGIAVLPRSEGFTLDTVGTWTVVVKVNGVEIQRQDIYVGDANSLPAVDTTTTLLPTG